MKNNLLILILLITAGSNLQAMDDGATAAAASGAGAGAEQQQEICNNPDCTQSADKHCSKCTVSYCSAECQRTDWRTGHELYCKGYQFNAGAIALTDVPGPETIRRVMTQQESTALAKLLVQKAQDPSLDKAQRKHILGRIRHLQTGSLEIDGFKRLSAPQTPEDAQRLATYIASAAAREAGVKDRDNPALQQILKGCTHCQKENTRKICTRCRGARYCDVQCQRDHWPTHKAICQKTRTKSAAKR